MARHTCPAHLHRLNGLLLGALAAWSLGLAAQAGSPLHERIDQLLERDAVTPVAGLVDDATFFRRASLDLNGRIPAVAEVRAFLADSAPGKRAKLVDDLLARPEYARHMAITFDVMLMERRPDKYVKQDPWREHLFTAFRENRPYHELVAGLLSADGAGPETHTAAKFYLEREAEPNAVTRDLGRVFFGRDLQCAQCHDHPRVDDYLQPEYYGLYAFVNRTYLFRPDTKQPAMLAEKADGTANYKSVFTSIEGDTNPRLPGGRELKEPVVAKNSEWKVRPDPKKKTVRPVPTYSRRAELPKLISEGSNDAFRRNIVNRLWAQLMGRGLVEPVDFHHSANPPTHPGLLSLLAAEFAAMNFDVKAFLRELALTRAYQRRLDLPERLAQAAQDAAKKLTAREAGAKQLQTASIEAWDRHDKLKNGLRDAFKEVKPFADKVAKAKADEAKLVTTHDTAHTALEKAEQALKEKRDKHAARKLELEKQAAGKSEAEAKKLDPAKDSALRKLDTEIKTATAAHSKAATAEAAAAQKLKELRDKSRADHDSLAKVETKYAAVEREVLAAEEQRRQAVEAAKLAARELEELQALVEYGRVFAEAKKAGGPEAAAAAQALDVALEEVTGKLSGSFAVAGLTPLTPEQLCWSLLQATGEIDRNLAPARADFEKKRTAKPAAKDAKAKAAKAPAKPEPPVPTDERAYVENYVYDKLKSRENQFVNLFGGMAGTPQNAFFATADQALYFENAGDLRSWLNPSGENLTARLAKETDPARFAGELYLSAFTRQPTAREVGAVTKYLKGREQDRPAAVQELAWALLTSIEFRFRH